MRALLEQIGELDENEVYGRVIGVRGLMVEVAGPLHAMSVGSRVVIETQAQGRLVPIPCEVVGFSGGHALLMPFAPLEGVRRGCRAVVSSVRAAVRPCQAWLGRVVNAMGEPIDGKGPLQSGPLPYPFRASPPTGRVWPGQHMVMDPTGAQVKLPGLHTTEPTFGLPATWVDIAQKEEATMKGYTVVDAATVLSTHLTELLKANTAELLSYAEVHKLIKDLPKEQGELVKDIVPAQITVSGIQRVLQLLLNERVSIRDLATILEGIADALSFTRNPIGIAEHVRTRLARQICAQHTTPAGYLPLIALSAKWEQNFAESIVGTGDDRSLAMQPSRLSEFITSVRERFEDAAREGEAPVLVTSPQIRPFVRGIVERFRAQTSVMSQSEIHPRVRLKTVGSI